MQTFHFNKIVIIQSLPEGEFSSGSRIREDLCVLKDAMGFDLEIELYDIKTKNDFLELLKKQTETAKSNGDYPIIHIEAHGSADQTGIILSTQEYVSWKDLKEPLMELNMATRNNLFIVLAVCHGAYMIELFQPSDRTPFWGLVGPRETITPDSTLRNYTDFYKEVLTSSDGKKAVNLLVPEAYYFQTAEDFFKKVFRKYLIKGCSPKAIENRSREIRKTLKKLKAPKIPTIGAVKRQFRDTEKHFKKYKNTFLMIDLFPENTDRFSVKYSDINK